MSTHAASCFAADEDESLFDKWFSVSANIDGGFRKTQFFEPDHDAGVAMWDSRAEIWLPPHQGQFSYGPYIRFAGIVATRNQPWENAFLAAPGAGFQLYPFSLAQFRESDSTLGKLFGPLRLFGEYNRTDYWGTQNSWRPHEQIRAGTEYWRAFHVNDTTKPWWLEFWTVALWQSANEFDPHYDTFIFANAIRSGIRKPKAGFLSSLSPYLAVESQLTDHHKYYWENKLLMGGGIRFTPAISHENKWLNRFVVFAEYLHTAAYYHNSPPSSIPDYDVRVGVSMSLGKWYYTDNSNK